MLAKGTAMELAPFNIRVHSVHPGLIDTPMVSIVTEDEASLSDTLKTWQSGNTSKTCSL
ncbi:MAG: SDR family oxidoreductase [Balneolales bacterium]